MAVLPTVKIAVAAAVPVTLTGEGMLQVTGLIAPDGTVVTAQLRLTLPVNPFDGVTLIVEVLPVVAPAVIVTLVPERANVGAIDADQAFTTLATLRDPRPDARS